MNEPEFFFDENLSRRIADALKALRHQVHHILDYFSQGTPDTEYFGFVGERGWFLVTQDKRIKRNPHERRALLQAGVGAFIFTGRVEKSVDEMTVHLLQRLPEIIQLAKDTDRPFIYGITDRGKISRLD